MRDKSSTFKCKRHLHQLTKLHFNPPSLKLHWKRVTAQEVFKKRHNLLQINLCASLTPHSTALHLQFFFQNQWNLSTLLSMKKFKSGRKCGNFQINLNIFTKHQIQGIFQMSAWWDIEIYIAKCSGKWKTVTFGENYIVQKVSKPQKVSLYAAKNYS